MPIGQIGVRILLLLLLLYYFTSLSKLSIVCKTFQLPIEKRSLYVQIHISYPTFHFACSGCAELL